MLLLEKKLIKDLFYITEDYLDIESLANKLQIHPLMLLLKMASIPAIPDVGRYTIHESQLVNMPLAITGRL